MRVKLTKRVCLDLEPEDTHREEIFWDEDGSGLGVRVTKQRPDGRRGRYFVFGYRTRIRLGDTPRKSKWRIYQLGTVAKWTLHQARDEVIRLNAQVNEGGDPVEDRRQARRKADEANTVSQLAAMVMERHHNTTWEEPPPIGRRKVEPKYVREDRSKWQRWVLPRMGSLIVADVTVNHVDEMLRHVSQEAGTTTSNRVRSMISKAFSLSEVWQLRPQHSNPTAHSVKHTEERRERILSREELVRVLDATDTLLDQARQLSTDSPQAQRNALSEQRQLLAIRLAAETMRRPDEIFRLQWRWARFEERIIALPKVKADRKGKRAIGQTFGLSEQALAVLHQAKAIAGDSAFVFPSLRSDSAGHISTVKRMWAAVLKQAGIADKPDLYTLKHTMISLSDEAGVELGGIRDQAGHGDIRTTEIYRRGTDRQKVATASALSRYVEGLRNQLQGAHT